MTTNTFDPGPEWVETKNHDDAVLVLYDNTGFGFVKGWVPRAPLPAWTVAEKPNGVRCVKHVNGNWYGVLSGIENTFMDESTLTILSRPVETDK